MSHNMDDLSQALGRYGIDYEDAMERFDGSASFYKKLALRYLEVTYYQDLDRALKAGDFDEAYQAAHTLKGTSGNLSLTRLYEAASSLTAALREGDHQRAHTLMEPLRQANDQAVLGLKAWQDGKL